MWADAAPEERVCRVIGVQGAMLKVWNVWRAGESAAVHEASGNAGMLIEDTPDGATLSCSNGVGAADFQDFVIRLELIRGNAK